MTFRSLGITLQKPTTNDRRLPDRNQKSKIQKKIIQLSFIRYSI